MKLYYSPGACSLSPHIVALEAGLALELQRVDTKTKTARSDGDFWKINPKGYVPALEIAPGEVLTEGPAIVQYLGDQKPQSGLVPKAGSLERYRQQEMLSFITSEIHKAYSPLFNSATPAETVEDRKATLRKRFFGDQFTAADAYLFTVTTWASYVKLDLSEFPNLVAFQARVAARPAVKEAMRQEAQQ